jgi:hypothetical protein
MAQLEGPSFSTLSLTEDRKPTTVKKRTFDTRIKKAKAGIEPAFFIQRLLCFTVSSLLFFTLNP